jgi:hypothetical protein
VKETLGKEAGQSYRESYLLKGLKAGGPSFSL